MAQRGDNGSLRRSPEPGPSLGPWGFWGLWCIEVTSYCGTHRTEGGSGEFEDSETGEAWGRTE